MIVDPELTVNELDEWRTVVPLDGPIFSDQDMKSFEQKVIDVIHDASRSVVGVEASPLLTFAA